jgi:integrase
MAGRKRANGEGSISQHPDGRWWARITVDGKRKAYYGQTRKEVQQKLTAVLRDLHQGITPAPQQETVAHFLTRWLDDVARPRLRPSTFVRYRQLVHHHAIPVIGSKRLHSLSPADMQWLLAKKLSEGLAPATVLQLRAVLRRAFDQALKWGLVGRNVAALVDPPPARRAQVEAFTPDQVREFLVTVRGSRLEALYTVAVALGLRQGEALGLRWCDVDLETGTLWVRKALQRIDGELRLVDPKTERSRRTLDLPAAAVAALKAHRARQLEERLQVGPLWQDSGLVFTTAVGTPLDGGNVRRDYRALLKRARLPHLKFHGLRHTAASLLLAQNVHPRLVMETLGHSQITLTMDTYSHVIPSLRRQVADQMDAILSANA